MRKDDYSWKANQEGKKSQKAKDRIKKEGWASSENNGDQWYAWREEGVLGLFECLNPVSYIFFKSLLHIKCSPTYAQYMIIL